MPDNSKRWLIVIPVFYSVLPSAFYAFMAVMLRTARDLTGYTFDVMHAERVPALAAWLQNWTRKVFDFYIMRRREFDDVEGPDARAVKRHAILREANQPVVELQDSAGRTRAAFVVSDDRAFGMFAPWSS